MREKFDPPEEDEPEELCEDYRPTKQDIEDERADYLIQCAKDERAERRLQ